MSQTIKTNSRLEFLATQFNVLYENEFDQIISNLSESSLYEFIERNGNIIALKTRTVKKTSEFMGASVVTYKDKIYLHENLFISIVQSDPTENKIYIQWMLNVVLKYIKEGNYESALQFALEDLLNANEYLKIFDANKRKHLFKNLCKLNSDLFNITDPTNINQYKNLSQLYDVVDPFIERDPSELEITLQRYVNLKQAVMVRDRHFTLFNPLSLAASVVFSKFASWCTARKGNTMFGSYTSKRSPSGVPSKLYIIIDNNFFNGVSDGLWQIHFETNQIRNRKNVQDEDIFRLLIEKSEILRKYLYDELIISAKILSNKSNYRSPKTNLYLRYLTKLGFHDCVFEALSDSIPSFTFKDLAMPKMPNLSRFKNLHLIYLDKCQLKEMDRSITNINNLEQLSIPNNNIKEIPSFIGDCKKLVFINLIGNNIQTIANEISLLDPSKGGNLRRISVTKEDIGEKNFNKLKTLLPNVEIGYPT